MLTHIPAVLNGFFFRGFHQSIQLSAVLLTQMKLQPIPSTSLPTNHSLAVLTFGVNIV